MTSAAPEVDRRVQALPGVDLGAAALLAARDHDAIVILCPEGAEPPRAVTDLLRDPGLGIGAVVPAPPPPSGLIGPAAGIGPSAAPLRADVTGAVGPWIAARPELITTAGLPPAGGDPAGVAEAVARRARHLGLRIVADQAWEQAEGDGTRLRPGGPDDSPLLVVAGFVPGDPVRSEDRALLSLLDDLAGETTETRITLLAVDGFRAEPAADALRRRGLEVVHGSQDWPLWLSERSGEFTTIIVTWSGLHSSLAESLRRYQSQASVALFLPSLPTRDIDGLRGYSPVEELDGLQHFEEQLLLRLREQRTWVDAVWCDRPEDAALLRASGRFAVVEALSPAPARRSGPPGEGGAGLLVLATEGHDVLKGNEEAALVCLEELLPALRRSVPGLPCTVVAERPTPRLETRCREASAELVTVDTLPERLRDADLVLVAHQHGTGGPTVIDLALEAGTPFLASPRAAEGAELRELRRVAVATDANDLLYRARRVLQDPVAARSLRALVRDLGERRGASAARRQSLRSALAAMGANVARRRQERWPLAPVPAPDRKPLVLVTLRPDGWEGDPVDPGMTAEDDESRYREWVRRFGPNRATLSALRHDLLSLRHRPTISILMPVYNTDAWMLREAVASVQDQIYDGWQLCIADDGSDRPETLGVLEELRSHPQVRIARLGGQSGISGATNAALAIADGEFVAFLDHDDVLKPHALAQVARWLNADPTLDVIYSDEDKLDEDGRLVQPYLKPDWSPDLLRTNNYLCHLTTIRRRLVEDVGGLRPAYDGSQDYDLVLRVTDRTDRIAHIPEPLYSWRITTGSAAGVADAKPYAIEAGKRAVADSLVRAGLPGRVDDTPWIGRHHPRYPLRGSPKVAIIIPTRDRRDLLERCVTSVLEKSTYRNFDLVLIDNQTRDGNSFGYMADLPARIIPYPFAFNYARMVNLAAGIVEADAFLFLNNDTEVINGEWIEAMLEHAMRPEVGAVGGRLYFGDDQPQHEGIYVGVLGWATNMNHRGHGLLGELVRNTSAVTGACTMIRPSVYWRVGGNDERLRVAYNDVDLCLRVRQAGLEVVYTPHARLYHHESSSRSGYEHRSEGPLFGERWEPRQRVDPYYSPGFVRDAAFRISLGEPERSMPN